MRGMSLVEGEDLTLVAPYAMAHRTRLTFSAENRGSVVHEVIADQINRAA